MEQWEINLRAELQTDLPGNYWEKIGIKASRWPDIFTKEQAIDLEVHKERKIRALFSEMMKYPGWEEEIRNPAKNLPPATTKDCLDVIKALEKQNNSLPLPRDHRT